MTWVSLVCLLALSSSVFGRSVPLTSYGGYGSSMPTLLPVMHERTIQVPLPRVESYGSTDNYGATIIPTVPKTLPVVPNYGGYGETTMTRLAPFETTFADNLCRGHVRETVIPIEDGRKFVVCLDDGKGSELFCPKGLFYHEVSRRCERRLGPLENVCASQPCLNGGLCAIDSASPSTYTCTCTPGFDGKMCELDSRICETLPCGAGPDVRCQSFRWGAALSYVCIFGDGTGYGLNAQQVHPSPCVGLDGPHALLFTDKGFIMCDGERMFVESCPGGTIWDDLNKACTWPDVQIGQPFEPRTLISKSSYGETLLPLPTPKVISTGYGGYGSEIVTPKVLTRVDSYGTSFPVVEPKVISSGYGAEVVVPKVLPRVESYGETIIPKVLPRVESYGETFIPKVLPRVESYGETFIPKVLPKVESYGETFIPKVLPKVESYGETLIPAPEPKLISSGYGGEFTVPKVLPKLNGYGESIVPRVLPRVGGYGESIVPRMIPKVLPRVISSSY